MLDLRGPHERGYLINPGDICYPTRATASVANASRPNQYSWRFPDFVHFLMIFAPHPTLLFADSLLGVVLYTRIFLYIYTYPFESTSYRSGFSLPILCLLIVRCTIVAVTLVYGRASHHSMENVWGRVLGLRSSDRSFAGLRLRRDANRNGVPVTAYQGKTKYGTAGVSDISPYRTKGVLV